MQKLNKEILFKAKERILNTWVEGYFILKGDKPFIVKTTEYDIGYTLNNISPISLKTLCEYVCEGKHGVKLFTGDYDAEGNMIIFCERCMGYQFAEIDILTKDVVIRCNNCDGNFMFHDHVNDFDVTHNIHDNHIYSILI